MFVLLAVIAAWKEPTPGWTISKNGPQGFLMGASKGVVRRLPVPRKIIYDYIPVDIVTNELIVAAFHAGMLTERFFVLKFRLVTYCFNVL